MYVGIDVDLTKPQPKPLYAKNKFYGYINSLELTAAFFKYTQSNV